MSRNFSQSVVPRWRSQTPAQMIGMESKNVRKLRIPTKLLLSRTMIAVFLFSNFFSAAWKA
uniref:Tetraspanin-8-like n=1 Tax=Rhizophora mucronata TaxID=61149 RepID=A0A2P2ILE4_RHIMU